MIFQEENTLESLLCITDMMLTRSHQENKGRENIVSFVCWSFCSLYRSRLKHQRLLDRFTWMWYRYPWCPWRPWQLISMRRCSSCWYRKLIIYTWLQVCWVNSSQWDQQDPDHLIQEEPFNISNNHVKTHWVTHRFQDSCFKVTRLPSWFLWSLNSRYRLLLQTLIIYSEW